MATPIKKIINEYFKNFKVKKDEKQTIEKIVCEVTGFGEGVVNVELSRRGVFLQVESSSLAYQLNLYKGKIIKRARVAGIDMGNLKIKVKGE